MKFDEETGGKRKLSKRKDPELSLDYYRQDGYHPYCMKVYLLTLLNSNFEEWHEKFPDKDINEFPFSVDKMNQSGALFDKDKLHNICKNELSKLSEDEVYEFLKNWAFEYEKDKAPVWFADKEKMLAILRLYMGVGMKRRRKDLVYAKQIFELISYFFDMEGDGNEKDEFRLPKDEADKLLKCYLESYSHEDDNTVWFDKLKAIADNNGYASDMKAYKANPENYKGNVSDVAEVIRIAVTGRANTPDLWSIVHIMGEAQMRQRIAEVCGK
jgi:glutamyl-tRNA synthetase